MAHQISSGMNIKSYYGEDQEARSQWWEQFTRNARFVLPGVSVKQHKRMNSKGRKYGWNSALKDTLSFGECRAVWANAHISIHKHETGSLCLHVRLEYSEAERRTGRDKEGDWVSDLFFRAMKLYFQLSKSLRRCEVKPIHFKREMNKWHAVRKPLFEKEQRTELLLVGCDLNQHSTAAKQN